MSVVTNLSVSTIKRSVEDGTFPAPVPIGKRRKAWVRVAVIAWCDARAAAARGAVVGAPLKAGQFAFLVELPVHAHDALTPEVIMLPALGISIFAVLLLLRRWLSKGGTRPEKCGGVTVVGSTSPTEGSTSPAEGGTCAEAGDSIPAATASAVRKYRRQHTDPKPGREARAIRAHVARIAPQAFVEVTGELPCAAHTLIYETSCRAAAIFLRCSIRAALQLVTGEGATCPVPKSIVGSKGNACANPSAFFITSTVVAPGHRLWFMDAYHAYQSDAWKHGLSSVPIDQFGRAATNLGFARGKASSRYFRDRALRLEPPSPPTTNPNGNNAEDKLCAFNQRKITE